LTEVEAVETLPATSVACAVIEWVPSARAVGSVYVHAPAPFVEVVPIGRAVDRNAHGARRFGRTR
jgi:hypothetical protein